MNDSYGLKTVATFLRGFALCFSVLALFYVLFVAFATDNDTDAQESQTDSFSETSASEKAPISPERDDWKAEYVMECVSAPDGYKTTNYRR